MTDMREGLAKAIAVSAGCSPKYWDTSEEDAQFKAPYHTFSDAALSYLRPLIRAEALEEAAKIMDARVAKASEAQRRAFEMGWGIQGERHHAEHCLAAEAAAEFRRLKETGQ